eukprot:scaffold57136_cov47-Attheya_sp.AAC.2
MLSEEQEIEIEVPPDETEGLVDVDGNDTTVDPLESGFLWYKPSRTVTEQRNTGGHKWTISGHDMQVLTSTVPPGDEFMTETGSFMYMHPQMTSEVELTLCGGKGGCAEGWSRICGGESCAKVMLRNPGSEEGYVGMTPNFPAKIIPVEFGVTVSPNSSLIAQGGSIMSQLGDVTVGCSLDCGFATCCCAGMGLCRQKITGGNSGVAFMAAGGTILQRDLQANETITVDGGSVVMFEDSVQLGIIPSGRLGMCCCGGEGCFNTTLSGPGKVWLQSMNFLKFQNAVRQTVMEDRQGADGDDGGGGDDYGGDGGGDFGGDAGDA